MSWLCCIMHINKVGYQWFDLAEVVMYLRCDWLPLMTSRVWDASAVQCSRSRDDQWPYGHLGRNTQTILYTNIILHVLSKHLCLYSILWVCMFSSIVIILGLMLPNNHPHTRVSFTEHLLQRHTLIWIGLKREYNHHYMLETE